MISVDILFSKGAEEWDAGNLKVAFELFKRAADLGDGDSMNNVAIFYENGIGLEKNIRKAIFWYENAFPLIGAVAANNLASLYKNLGESGKAVVWYHKAIELGDGDAMVELGEMYLYGEGVSRSCDEAAALFVGAIESTDITDESKGRASEHLSSIHFLLGNNGQ